PLPYGATANDTPLAMLGNMLNKEPSTANNETLHDIIESDIPRTSNHTVVTMIGRPGSGKTATVIAQAMRHFVVYCVCSPLNNARLSEADYIIWDDMLTLTVKKRIRVEFLGRLLFLYLLFSINRDITPQQYFHEQINGGTRMIESLIDDLLQYTPRTITNMLTAIQLKLRTLMAPQKRGLVIAVDEAQHAISSILPKRFISPMALAKKRQFLAQKGGLIEHYLRGFFAPLLSVLGEIPATVVVLGTSLSLQVVDQVTSAISKGEDYFKSIVKFPRFDVDEMRQLLSSLLAISKRDLPQNEDLYMLTGRTCFTMAIIRQLIDESLLERMNKRQRLTRAFDSAQATSRRQISEKVEELLNGGKDKYIVKLLSRMVLSYKLQAGRTSFTNESDVDLVQSTLCGLSPVSDGLHYMMDEPLVVKAVEGVLKRLNIDPDFTEYSVQFERI
ncbi:hypothetical protein BGZ76_006319, partial [Entomortierella beljakovae]